MPCYYPLRAWRSKVKNESGKRPLVFKREEGFADMEVQLPCGQCRGCRLAYSRDWAIRCVHEAQMHERNSFITLTYNDKNLPRNGSVQPKELQDFFKRLRRRIEPEKIRYFACGEYGEKKRRPHYHAIIFGYDFPDKLLYSKSGNGDLLFRSPLLESVWKKGFSTIGEVTFESAAYVARYVMKKQETTDGTPVEKKMEIDMRYSSVDGETGEVLEIEREFARMSRGRRSEGTGGIGFSWLQKFGGDTDKDFVTIKGVKMKLPEFYDEILAEMDPEDMVRRKAERYRKVKREDYTYERLTAKEKVKKAQINMLKRGLENET